MSEEINKNALDILLSAGNECGVRKLLNHKECTMRKVTITLEVVTGKSVSNEAIMNEVETLLDNSGSNTTIYFISNKDIYDGCVGDNFVTTFEHYSAINTKAEEEYYEGKLSVVNKMLAYLEEEKHNRDIFMESLGRKGM